MTIVEIPDIGNRFVSGIYNFEQEHVLFTDVASLVEYGVFQPLDQPAPEFRSYQNDGETFDFTTIDPLGVEAFLLAGIDETELIDSGNNANPPLVFGATFTDAGIANFVSIPLFEVQPGDFDQDTDIDGNDFLEWQRGASPNALSQTDLNDWQVGFGEMLNPVEAAVSIPEPSTLLLAGLAGVLLFGLRRQ